MLIYFLETEFNQISFDFMVRDLLLGQVLEGRENYQHLLHMICAPGNLSIEFLSRECLLLMIIISYMGSKRSLSYSSVVQNTFSGHYSNLAIL